MHYHYLKVLLFWVSSSYFWSLIYLFKEIRDHFKQAVVKIWSVALQTNSETDLRFQ